MHSLKENLKEKVKTIVYEKAKDEVRAYFSKKINTIKKKIRAFFGLGESRKERLERIAKFYTDKEDIGHQNLLTGVVELFTLNYMQTMADMMSHSMRDKPEQEQTTKINR